MAKWTNLKFKTWMNEIEPASLSQEKFKNEAIKFSKDDKMKLIRRQLQKSLMTLKKSTKR